MHACAPTRLRLPVRACVVQEREGVSKGMQPANGDRDNPLYYESLESTIQFDIDTPEPHEFGYTHTMSKKDEEWLMELINPAAQGDRSPGQTAARAGGRHATAQEQAAARAAAKATARKAARNANPQSAAQRRVQQ